MFKGKYLVTDTIVWRGYFARLTKNQAEESGKFCINLKFEAED